MHVQHPLAAGAFMQVIDILRDQQEVVPQPLFQIRQRAVSGVGRDLRRLQLAAARVVKRLHQRRVALIAFRRGDVFDLVLFPQPVRGAEGANARFGRNAGPGQHHDKRLFQLGRRHGVTVKNA